jgi:hypothetical protein
LSRVESAAAALKIKQEEEARRASYDDFRQQTDMMKRADELIRQ